MTVTDEDMVDVRSRVHSLEVEHRGQLQLTTHVLGRLGTIDGVLVDHTKYLVESRQRQDQMERRLDRMEQRLDRMEQRLDQVEQRLDRVEQRLDQVEQQLAQIMSKLDALPAALAALIKPAND